VADLNDEDLAVVAGLLSSKKHCPLCDALAWTGTERPLAIQVSGRGSYVQHVPVACGECGYTMFFNREHLAHKAAELESELPGR
jgi:ribosomal protein S27AE